jgi:hypothetical protein
MALESDSAKARRAEHEARERGESPYGGVPGAAPLATRAAPPPSAATRAGKGFVGWLKTAVITLGVLYIAGYAATVGLISASISRSRWLAPASFQTEASVGREVRNKYRLAIDPTISPMQAGEELASISLQGTTGGPWARRKPILRQPSAPWRVIPLPRDLFPGTRANSRGLPGNTEILKLARRPLSADQKQALRMIGTAEVWKSFDYVARAGAVDILGGFFESPLGRMPLLEGGQGITRDYGTASYSRAAWHLAEGRKDSAVAALRAMISFGAVIEASALQRFDAITAGRMVADGYSALRVLYEVTGDPRAEVMRKELQDVAPGAPRVRRMIPAVEAHEAYLRAVADPAMLPADRLYSAQLLRYSTCASVRGIVAGGDERVAAALQQLRNEIARFPSEVEYFDLVVNTPQDFRFALRPGPRMFVDAGDFMARIYFNPQFRTCTMASSIR